MKYKMNNFSYINTLTRKRNEPFSDKKVKYQKVKRT